MRPRGSPPRVTSKKTMGWLESRGRVVLEGVGGVEVDIVVDSGCEVGFVVEYIMMHLSNF